MNNTDQTSKFIWPMNKVFVIFFSTLVILYLLQGSMIYFAFTFVEKLFNEAETNEISTNTTKPTYAPTFTQKINETRGLWKLKKFKEALVSAGAAHGLAKTTKEKAIADYWAGLNWHEMGNNKMAEIDLETAIEDDPNYVDAYSVLANVRVAQLRYKEALQLSEKCLQLDKKYAACYNSAGMSQAFLRDKQAAIESIETAISFDPNNQTYKDNLIKVRNDL